MSNTLIGLGDVLNDLINLHNSNRLPNKLLLSGTQGIGKGVLSKHLLNYILSKNEPLEYDLKKLQINPINKSYKLFESNAHPNVFKIHKKKDKKTDLLLILASRSENISKIINKNYQKKIILIDRFSDSTVAYQHYGMGLNLNIIKNLNSYIIGKFKPDLTFLCTVNNENMNNRLKIRSNNNRYDNFKIIFYNKVKNGFLKLSKNKKKYVLLDSNNSTPAENLNRIIKEFNKIAK